MPSKRKKNKRRMRRVQAQRRALEEQHAANPPIKASSGTAVSAPPITTPKKAAKPAAKTAPPTCENLPQAIPISVPLVEPPKEEAQPIVIEDAPEVLDDVATVESGALLMEQASNVLEVESRLEDEVEGPAQVTKDEPVESSPPAKPSTLEADPAQEAEASVSETEPVFEVAAPEEAPAEVASEPEIQKEDNEVIQKEADHTHAVCETEGDSVKAENLAEEDAEAKLELEVEVAISEEINKSESVKEAAEETELEDLTSDKSPSEAEPVADKTETDTGSEEEAVTDTVEPEKEAEVSPSELPEEEEEKLGDVAEEDLAALSVESVTAAEDAFAPSLEIRKVLNTITEAPMDEADLPVVKTKEGAADLPVRESFFTESVSAVKDAVSASTLVQQETERTGDTFTPQTKSTDAADADGPVAPTEENATEQTCLDVLTDDAKSGDLPCQMQLPVEAEQFGAVDHSVEMSQNGNVVPEVSIEG